MKCHYPVKKSIIFDIPGFPDPGLPSQSLPAMCFSSVGDISPKCVNVNGEQRNATAIVWNETEISPPLMPEGGYT